MNVAGVAAEAGGDATAVSECGLSVVADEYLCHVAPSCRWRFDVVTVFYERRSSQPLIELFRNTFPVA
jgi:hypothetical protein